MPDVAKLKILQVGSALHGWGGIERYLMYLTEGLQARGHSVTVVCPKDSPLARSVPSTKANISIGWKYSLASVPAYLRLFRSQRWDAVNMHYSKDYFAPAVAARLARMPLVVLTRHVVIPWPARKAEFYVKNYHLFLGVAGAVARALEQSGISKDKVRVAYGGCPALVPSKAREVARSELGISDGRFVLGFFGRLVEEKGVDTLIAAKRFLPESVSIEIFGDGAQRKALELAASDGSGGAQVRFHGSVPDVTDAMHAMDAVVLPSAWEEAFPYSALEAMSLARPVIATRTGGLPEMISDGETGVLFERGNPRELSERVLALQSDRSLASAMGECGRKRQQSEFGVAQMAQRVEEAYLSACAHPSP